MESQEAQNQEIVINVKEHSSDSQQSKKRSSFEEGDVEEPNSSSDFESPILTRSNALTARTPWKPKHAWPAKEPMQYEPMDQGSDDDEEGVSYGPWQEPFFYYY